jgi:8-oxo-dGTP pyrophosphatase MutT (NUDIX family)
MIKHATASVFLFARQDAGWRIGLIHHPRLQRWMLPGGHLEPDENPAQAALREVREETGAAARLVTTNKFLPAACGAEVPVPLWIAEQHVPAEPRHPHPHIHVDHLYVAVARDDEPSAPAELRFGWFKRDDLSGMHMFDESRSGAELLFENMDELVAPTRQPAE